MIDKEKSLAYRFPELAKEWHPTKNGDLTPHDVTYGSSKKVWWLCSKCGRSWEAVIKNRQRGSGCLCEAYRRQLESATKKRIAKTGSLFEIYPDIAKQWHPTKNEFLSAEDVTEGSHKKVWWQCSNGHAYQRTIREQVKGIECPYCSNKKLLSGCNDITITHPQLLRFWNYEKNDKQPHSVLFNGTDKYWWKFECGHERYATCKAVENFPKCIYCYGQKVSQVTMTSQQNNLNY